MKWAKGKIFLATKFGLSEGGLVLSGKLEYMKFAAEKSLKTLVVDCIDLYYLHKLLSSVFNSSSGEAIEHCLFLHYSYQTPISTHHQINKELSHT